MLAACRSNFAETHVFRCIPMVRKGKGQSARRSGSRSVQLQSKEANKITIEGRRGRTVLCNCMHAAYPRAEAVSVLRTQGERLGGRPIGGSGSGTEAGRPASTMHACTHHFFASRTADLERTTKPITDQIEVVSLRAFDLDRSCC